MQRQRSLGQAKERDRDRRDRVNVRGRQIPVGAEHWRVAIQAERHDIDTVGDDDTSSADIDCTRIGARTGSRLANQPAVTQSADDVETALDDARHRVIRDLDDARVGGAVAIDTVIGDQRLRAELFVLDLTATGAGALKPFSQ